MPSSHRKTMQMLLRSVTRLPHHRFTPKIRPARRFKTAPSSWSSQCECGYPTRKMTNYQLEMTYRRCYRCGPELELASYHTWPTQQRARNR